MEGQRRPTDAGHLGRDLSAVREGALEAKNILESGRNRGCKDLEVSVCLMFSGSISCSLTACIVCVCMLSH